MKNIFYIFSIVFLFSATLIYSDNLQGASGLALPPYIIHDDNSGMELDIIREVLKKDNHELSMNYMPFIRIKKSMTQKKVDLAFPITEASGVENVYYSDSHITYQNVAVSLKSKNLKINSISDLQGKNIIAFQDATLYLGDEYLNSVANSKYREMAKQDGQVAMLFGKRTDVIIIDKNIFTYFKKNIKKVDTDQEYVFHEIFPKTYYKIAFTDKTIRDHFNKNLKLLKDSGEYDAIISKYLE